MRNCVSPSLSEVIWLRLYNDLKVTALPTEKIEGDAAGKNPLLCRCGDDVDDDAYGNTPTLFDIFPFLKGNFLSTA